MMPERIWARGEQLAGLPESSMHGRWAWKAPGCEYTRTDLVAAKDAEIVKRDAEIERLRKVIEQLLGIVKHNYDSGLHSDITNTTHVAGFSWTEDGDQFCFCKEAPELAAYLREMGWLGW